MVSHVSTSFIIIPARLESTRLPRKLLLRETGRTVLQHTFEAATRARKPSGVWVAADAPEIVTEVQRFGGQVELTDPHAASGTDRVAELARRLPRVDIIVNVQGDEPEISPAAIDAAIELLERDPQISSLALDIMELAARTSPSRHVTGRLRGQRRPFASVTRNAHFVTVEFGFAFKFNGHIPKRSDLTKINLPPLLG